MNILKTTHECRSFYRCSCIAPGTTVPVEAPDGNTVEILIMRQRNDFQCKPRQSAWRPVCVTATNQLGGMNCEIFVLWVKGPDADDAG